MSDFSPSVMFLRTICTRTCVSLHSFSWLNTIPLHGSLLTRSPAGGYLGCLYCLALVNTTAVNIHGQRPFKSLLFILPVDT